MSGAAPSGDRLPFETLLELLYPRLKDSDVALEFLESMPQELALAAFIEKGHCDPPQPFDDHEVLLFEALEPAVDLVEMAEAAKRVNASISIHPCLTPARGQPRATLD